MSEKENSHQIHLDKQPVQLKIPVHLKGVFLFSDLFGKYTFIGYRKSLKQSENELYFVFTSRDRVDSGEKIIFQDFISMFLSEVAPTM